MIVSLIAAIDEDDVIGTGHGGLPWRLPAEAHHFRAYTRGKWMLLGRTTFDEMHGWFTDQTPLVLTHRPGTLAPPGRAVDSIEEAITIVMKADTGELVVAGGGQVFALTFPVADRLVLTRVHTHTGGSVKFPPFKHQDWHETSRTHHPADPQNPLAFTITVLDRPPRVG
jgi:dihydrofolate reductase